MGVFDTIEFRCPHCTVYIEEQTKSGDCILGHYNINRAPVNAVMGILGDGRCYECQKDYTIEMVHKPIFEVRKKDDN